MKLLISSVIVVVVALAAEARAASTVTYGSTISAPETGGRALDLCENFGVGCDGWQAASAWCAANGYPSSALARHAVRFGIARDYLRPTRTIGDHKTCISPKTLFPADTLHPAPNASRCDYFLWVQCVKTVTP